MDYNTIAILYRDNPTFAALRKEWLPLAVSFLHYAFKRRHEVTLPQDVFREMPDTYLEHINATLTDDRQYKQTASYYLDRWSREDDLIRVRSRESGYVVQLSPHAERLIGWIEEMQNRGMIFPAVSLQRTGEFQTGLIRVPEADTYYLLMHGNLSTAINPVYDFTLYFTHNPDMPLLEYGDEIKGTLTADERMQFYRFEADFGDIIDLNAYTEGDIDVYFSLYTPGISLRDDDSGPGLDPEISGLLLHDGEHVIGVGAFHAGRPGFVCRARQRSPHNL